MNPLISVCIPTYNGEQYLSEAIESVLAQTFRDFEIIIVDDASQDNTVEIAHQYGSKYEQIKVFRNTHNLGLVGNWNRCLTLGQGEWLKFVFQDDYIHPQCLETMMAYSHQDIPIMAVERAFLFEGDISDTDKDYYLSLPSIRRIYGDKIRISATEYSQALVNYVDKIYFNLIGEPTAVMFRRDVLTRFGIFNPHLIQLGDVEYWSRIAIHTGVTYIPETLATWRINPNSITTKNQATRYYRKNILDPLILLHDYVYHPLYQPLRHLASHQQPSLNLLERLATKAYDARRIAEKSGLLSEWQYIIDFYPILGQVSQRHTLSRLWLHGLYLLKQKSDRQV